MARNLGARLMGAPPPPLRICGFMPGDPKARIRIPERGGRGRAARIRIAERGEYPSYSPILNTRIQEEWYSPPFQECGFVYRGRPKTKGAVSDAHSATVGAHQ
jgi:hypothetical protein